MALTIFGDFRYVAGTTALCALACVLTALLPGSAGFESVQGVFGASWMFFTAKKAEFSHFLVLHFHVI